MKNPDRNYIVVVPEQYTMAIQKRLVSMHPRKGILNIDVVSFERLAYKVFEEVGEDNLEVLDFLKLLISLVVEYNKLFRIYLLKLKLNLNLLTSLWLNLVI